MDSSVTPVEDRAEIKPKMMYTGTVVKNTLAFAIVDIGIGSPAVIHISQLASTPDGQPVKRVEEILQVGQQVDVWVRKVKEGRVELTMNKPLDLDWRDIKPGMTVKGSVTKLEKFGAFVEIGAERPGLVHISEMAHGYVRTPGDVVKEGDEVEVQILDVNRKKKQIKLSMKALQEEPVKEEAPVRMIEDVQPQKERPARRRRPRSEERDRERGGNAGSFTDSSESSEPDTTAMEFAIREAMERAKSRKGADKEKRKEKVSREQEDLLTRTLETRK